MNVPRPAKLSIFELVPFEVREAVRHVRFAGEKRLLPDDRTSAEDPAGAFHMIGRGSDQDFRTKRGLPELGIGKPQIIVALRDVIAELVRQAKAEPVRYPIRTDQIDARQLRLLPAVLREFGNDKRLAGARAAGPTPPCKTIRAG